MPERERNLLVSAARLALLELSSCNKKPETTRPYFADPEKAEWGC